MIGIQPFFDYVKSKIKLSIVFEVVDAPEDQSGFRDYLKPIDVWFLFSNRSQSIPADPASFRAAPSDKVMFYPGLTKQTPRELRQWATLDTTFDKQYLYVLAEPPKEW